MMILRWHAVGHLIEIADYSEATNNSHSSPHVLTRFASILNLSVLHQRNLAQTISGTPWQHNFSPTIISPISTFRRDYIQMKEDWNIWPCRELKSNPCIFNLDIRWRWQWWFTSRKRIRVLLWIGRWLESKPAWNINHGSWTLEV